MKYTALNTTLRSNKTTLYSNHDHRIAPLLVWKLSVSQFALRTKTIDSSLHIISIKLAGIQAFSIKIDYKPNSTILEKGLF